MKAKLVEVHWIHLVVRRLIQLINTIIIIPLLFEQFLMLLLVEDLWKVNVEGLCIVCNVDIFRTVVGVVIEFVLFCLVFL